MSNYNLLLEHIINDIYVIVNFGWRYKNMTVELKYPKGRNGKTICQECGREFSLISPKHLKEKHNGMTMAEYKLKYPDCPISSKAFVASTATFRDSVLFKDIEGLPSEPLDSDIEIAELEDGKFRHSVLKLEGVSKNKVDILIFLHDAYPYLENNYSIEKRHFHDDRLLWKYITDMADPVKKVIFDFPDAFWHNEDPYPDPQKYDKLREDGWIVIVIDKHYPTVQDVFQDTDIISD